MKVLLFSLFSGRLCFTPFSSHLPELMPRERITIVVQMCRKSTVKKFSFSCTKIATRLMPFSFPVVAPTHYGLLSRKTIFDFMSFSHHIFLKNMGAAGRHTAYMGWLRMIF